jgi:hypothetical protein
VNRARLTWPAAALARFSHFLITRRGQPESERRNLLIRPATRAWRKFSFACIGGIVYYDLRTREEERFLNPTASLTSSNWLALLGLPAKPILQELQFWTAVRYTGRLMKDRSLAYLRVEIVLRIGNSEASFVIVWWSCSSARSLAHARSG